MHTLFGNDRQEEEWVAQVSYPKSMVPQHAQTFCGWSKKLRGTLIESKVSADLKDDNAEVVIERFEFRNYEDLAEFCRYTSMQLDKWSGAGAQHRYTIRVRGRVKFDDKIDGRVGASHPAVKADG